MRDRIRRAGGGGLQPRQRWALPVGNASPSAGPRDALRWFGETCDGIKYLHDRCQLARQGHNAQTHTILRGPPNQPTYMAPEQIMGQPHALAIDIWGIRVLAWAQVHEDMSTGRVAFRSPDA
eukprot:gene8533-27384_t